MSEVMSGSEYLRSLVENAADAFFVHDTGTGKIKDCNRLACESLGYTREEILLLSVNEIDTNYSDEAVRGLWGHLRPGEQVTSERVHRRKDGSLFPVEVRIVLLDAAESSLVLHMARDITALRQTEQRLKLSEKRLLDITGHMGAGLYVLDPGGRVTFMNSAAEKLLGWTFGELEGKNAHGLIHNCRPDGSMLPLSDCPIRKVIESGLQFSSTEEVFVRKDGAVFPISIVASPIFDDGRIVASVATFSDITELKKMERELSRIQRLESIGTLAGGIAHDFNNLLQAILGHISLAKLYTDPAGTAHQQLTKAEDASELAKELSFRLLTFSKGGEPYRQISSMSDLLLQTVRLSLSGSKVAAEFSIADDLSLVQIDEGQMRQVISNLAVNALEAMPDGGVLTVSAENVALNGKEGIPVRSGGYLHISFRDTGAGIRTDHLQKIFDPYFTTKRMGSQKGMGLGLSICHSIINKHEGFISVESLLGQGSVFHLYLPAAGTASGQAEGAVPASGKTRRRILFMDDDSRVREIVREMIGLLGYDIELAANGEDAVAAFLGASRSGKGFDAVILDFTVQGGMGGELAMKRLLEIAPDVKAIISSGYVDAPIMKEFRAYGFAGAMAKPYRLEDLRTVLCNVLS